MHSRKASLFCFCRSAGVRARPLWIWVQHLSYWGWGPTITPILLPLFSGLLKGFGWELRSNRFMQILPVLLGDNGSEFSDPLSLEMDAENNQKTQAFYCAPSALYQKGVAENNHEFIHRILPRGFSFDGLEQTDINRMMNHINSYKIANLGNRSPLWNVPTPLRAEDFRCSGRKIHFHKWHHSAPGTSNNKILIHTNITPFKQNTNYGMEFNISKKWLNCIHALLCPKIGGICSFLLHNSIKTSEMPFFSTEKFVSGRI